MEFSSVISIILFHKGILHTNFVAMKYRWKMSVFGFERKSTFNNGHLLSQLRKLINLQIRSLLISVNGTNCFANECSMSLCYLRTINYLQIGRERWETIHYLYILLIGKQVAVIDSEWPRPWGKEWVNALCYQASGVVWFCGPCNRGDLNVALWELCLYFTSYVTHWLTDVPSNGRYFADIALFMSQHLCLKVSIESLK